jgi:hypothetical protein
VEAAAAEALARESREERLSCVSVHEHRPESDPEETAVIITSTSGNNACLGQRQAKCGMTSAANSSRVSMSFL